MLELLETGPKLVGIKQSKRALEKGLVKIAYIARDADMHVVFPFEKVCKDLGVEICYADTMKELAKACKVDVNTAVAVILKNN